MRSMSRALMLVFLSGAAVSAAALSSATDERPIVLVDFAFYRNTCSRYGATRKAEAERFAQVVAGEFADEFQFAIWRTNATLLRGETAEATLTVQFRAHDEQSGHRRGVAYYIDYFRDVDMNEVRIPDRDMSRYIRDNTPLYEWDSYARPCGVDANFTNLLKTRIDKDISDFRDELMKSFLSYVPIAKELPGADDVHDGAVTLAVHWKPLHAGLKSEMELNVGGDVKASLSSIAIHDPNHDNPLTCAHVMSLKDAASVTRTVIKTVLPSYRANKYIRLFMTHYELKRDTHNYHVIVMQPD
jgi:hypothetical protein